MTYFRTICTILILLPQLMHAQELVVAPLGMNVVYRGLDNPIAVAVSGIPTDQLIVRCSNAKTFTGSGSRWALNPSNGGTCQISAHYITDGDTVLVGMQEFRVKNVPDPKPYFGGKTGTTSVFHKELVASAGVIAKMENFEFDLRFQIIGYDFVSDTGKGPIVIHCDGPAVHPDTKKVRWKLKEGGSVELINIMAKGPDGSERRLEDIRLSVIPYPAYGMGMYDAKNAHWVSWSIYRSAQPKRKEIALIETTATRNILNLRRINRDKRWAKETTVTVHHLPIKTRKMTEEELVKALEIIDNTHYNIVVHCKHGADRTGAVIAAYRVIYDNWSKESALIEMKNQKFGYHAFWFKNLENLIENLDVEGIRNELGVDRRR
jgi:tyrosine-protein phosphatase SIW14